MTDVETEVLSRIPVDLSRAMVYEHGWQSWSPTVAYRLDERPFRPVSEQRRVGNYHPDRDGAARRVLGRGAARRRPRHRRRRARLRRALGRRADPVGARAGRRRRGGRVGQPGRRRGRDPGGGGGRGPVPGPGPGAGAVGRPASRRRPGVGAVRAGRRRRGAPGTTTSSTSPRTTSRRTWPPSATWTSTSRSCRSTTATRPRSATGSLLSDRFASLARHRRPHPRRRPPGRHLGRAVPGGRAVGRSPASTPTGWSAGRPRRTTAGAASSSAPSTSPTPGPRPTCARCSAPSATSGIDYFKIDFIYAGRDGGPARRPTGSAAPRPTGTGCGPSARPSAPTPTCWAAARRSCPASAWSTPCGSARTSGTTSSPSTATSPSPRSAAAAQNSRWRAWQQGRFWTNDADCLVAGTHVERREDWADVVERYSGLRASSDRLRGLDEWGWRPPAGCCAPGCTAPFVP